MEPVVQCVRDDLINPTNVAALCFLADVLHVINIYYVKMSKYGVFSAPYFPAFGLNTGRCGPEKRFNFRPIII